MLDVAAIVGEFDEATRLGIAEQPHDPAAFARLYRLSVVRPSNQGKLTLHDDVRRILADELRWRNPDQNAALRKRAAAYYREQARPG